jgi:superfamily II DNA or RNA helicase
MKDNDWSGAVSLYWKDNNQSFYTGMLSVVTELLKQNKTEYVIEDRRPVPPENEPDLTYTAPKDHERRPYQDATLDLMYRATRGVLQAATGAGKTAMITRLIGKIKTSPFLFFVNSTDLLEQAYEDLSGSLNTPIGRIGAGEYDIQKINVVMVQSAIAAIKYGQNFDLTDFKYDDDETWEDMELDGAKAESIKNLIYSAKGFVFDECHHIASQTAKEVALAAKNAFWRYGCSATPFREDGAEMMIQALLGRKLANISLSYLIRENYLLRPLIIMIDMGDEDLGKWSSWQEIYKNYVVKNRHLNELSAEITNFLVKKGISVLNLVRTYPHGESIKEIYKEKYGDGDLFFKELFFIRGDQSRKKRKEALNQLRDGALPAVVATTLADEGLDVRRLGAAIVSGGGKSITRVYQRTGRTLRKFGGQDRAFVFFFHHKATHLDDHAKRILHILKQEDEFVIKKVGIKGLFPLLEKAVKIPDIRDL